MGSLERIDERRDVFKGMLVVFGGSYYVIFV
jgi:hypothetical protein